jgi:hypothetical protein
MDLKIPSAIVDRQMFPKQTNKTEMGSGVETIVAAQFTCLMISIKEWLELQQRSRIWTGRGLQSGR